MELLTNNFNNIQIHDDQKIKCDKEHILTL